jgi:hypothetical protein
VQSEEMRAHLHESRNPTTEIMPCRSEPSLLIILVIILLGGFSGFGGGPFYGTGYYGGGGLGLILVIVLILVLLGRL